MAKKVLTLIKLQIPQEVIPGFEQEPDFFEGGARRKHAKSSEAARPGETSKETTREAAPARPARAAATARPAESRRRGSKSSIASDGFDYSKPYEPSHPLREAPTGEQASAGFPSAASRRNPRPIAVLLGGLGRK